LLQPPPTVCALPKQAAFHLGTTPQQSRRAGSRPGRDRPIERTQRGDGLRKMEGESGQLGGSRHRASAAAHLRRAS